jgi:membrane-associated phospholipid phosphatase
MSRPARSVALIAAWLLAIPLAIALLDRPAARFAHDVIGRHAPLRWLTLPIEYLVPLSLIMLAVLGLAALRRPLRGVAHTLLLATLALTIADALGDGLKRAFGRTWPETWTNHNPSWIDNHVFGFFPFHGGPGWASFPSGHMFATTSLLGVFWLLAPRLRPLWTLLIALMAIGLYTMDYHFISDIIAGTGLGAAVATVVVRLDARRASADR